MMNGETNLQSTTSLSNILFKWTLSCLFLHIIYVMVMLYLHDGIYNPRPDGWYHIGIGLLIYMAPLFLAIREQRDLVMGGELSYGGRYKVAFYYSLMLIGWLVIFYAIFYNYVIDWDVFLTDQLIERAKEAKERGASEEAMKHIMNKDSFFASKSFSLIAMSVFMLIMYALLNLVIAACVKTKQTNA